MSCEFCCKDHLRFIDPDCSVYDSAEHHINMYIDAYRDPCTGRPIADLCAEVSETVLGADVDAEVSVPINFCPFCGRNLKEDS